MDGRLPAVPGAKLLATAGPTLPAPGTPGDANLASLQLAVEQLAVDTIVLLGHSDCKWIQAVVANRLPDAPCWTAPRQAAALQRNVNGRMPAHVDPLDALSRDNIALQVQHLQAYPWAATSVRVIGAWLDLDSEALQHYCEATRTWSAPVLWDACRPAEVASPAGAHAPVAALASLYGALRGCLRSRHGHQNAGHDQAQSRAA